MLLSPCGNDFSVCPRYSRPKNAFQKDELKQEVEVVERAVREIAALFEEARVKRKKRIRGEADEPVVAKNRAKKRKK